MVLLRKILGALDEFITRYGDGIDTAEYVEAIERHFNIRIEITVLESLKTLGDLCDEIARLVTPATDRAGIWAAVRQITSYEMGVDANELNEQIRFVEDLCC